MVEGDKKPIYEETLEDVRRFNENPALPFNAFGTLALARAEFDANSGSSQVFFLLKVRLWLVLCSCLTNLLCFLLLCYIVAAAGLFAGHGFHLKHMCFAVLHAVSSNINIKQHCHGGHKSVVMINRILECCRSLS